MKLVDLLKAGISVSVAKEKDSSTVVFRFVKDNYTYFHYISVEELSNANYNVEEILYDSVYNKLKDGSSDSEKVMGNVPYEPRLSRLIK